VRHDATAQALHDLAFPGVEEPQVWDLHIDQPAVVLGSRQELSQPAVALAGECGVEIAHRRSGGGAVLIEPTTAVWVDVLVPAAHPWCGDDLTVAFLAVGERWAHVLQELGYEPEVCRSRPDSTDDLATQACFAGLGWGEVTIGGSKVVGLSQRRTRWGARVQCLADLSGTPARIGEYLELDPSAANELQQRCGRCLDPSSAGRDALGASFLALF